MNQNMRVAIRQEGPQVNAYVSQMGSMDSAVLIGSMSVAVLNMRPALFEQFKALMTAAMTAMVEVGLGAKVVDVHEQAAPEHEKAGHG